MSKLSPSRPFRYPLKSKYNPIIQVESKIGTSINLSAVNVSTLGVAAKANDSVEIEVDDICPAKILWILKDKSNEVFLGRILCKGISETEDGGFIYHFSVVDKRIDVEGQISLLISLEDGVISNFKSEINPDNISMSAFSGSEIRGRDILTKVHNFNLWYEEWKKRDRYQYSMIRSSSKGHKASFRINGKSNPKKYIVFGSNDYYGMSCHPKVIEASTAALNEYGVGSTGSFILTGNSDIHVELAKTIADTVKKERCFLYTSGYNANIGALTALASASDLIEADRLSHASIIDALSMCQATSRFFRHNDMGMLRSRPEEKRDDYSGCLIISEGIFSMDGVSCAIEELISIKNKYDARLYIDEAHSFGVLGKGGGLICEKGLSNEVDFIMGSLSKTTGAVGGFVACSKEVYRWLKMFARSAMFTANMPPAIAAANLQALKLIREDLSIIEECHKKTRHFISSLVASGFKIPANLTGFIVPVEIGDYNKFGKMNQFLLEKGIFVTGIVYPAVNKTQSRFRFTITSNHTYDDLNYTVENLVKAAKNADVDLLDKSYA